MIIYDKLHWLNGIIANAFLYEGEDGLILVDTGMRGRPRVLSYLQKLGREPADISHILVTHADIDHVGNLAMLQKATGATIIAGGETADLLKKGDAPSHGKGFVNNLVERFGGYEKIDAETIQTVKDGDHLELMGGLTVVATPGHTPDHISFYSRPLGIVLAGDALNSIGGSLGLMMSNVHYDYRQATVSATKLLNLAPVLFACGHGKPFLHDHSHLEAMFMSLRN